MRFTSFTIKNFKGIKDLTIDLADSPALSIYTLVGLNESGKTTILEAIDMFQNDVLQSQRHALIPRKQALNFTGNISIKAVIELSPDDKKQIYEFARTKYKFNLQHIGDTAVVTRIYRFKDSEYLKTSNTYSLELIGKTANMKSMKSMLSWDEKRWGELVDHIKNKMIPRIIYYPDFLFNFPEKIYLGSDSDSKNDVYKNMLQDVLDSLGGGLELEKHVFSRMKMANSDISKKRALESTLLKMGEKMTNTVIDPWDSIFSSQGNTGERKEVVVEHGVDNSVTSSSAGAEVEARYFISIGIKQGSDFYQIEERSLGFRWFFAFLMFTQFRKNRQSDLGETLFLVDEPASNLHSSMQKRLAAEISKIVDNSKLMFTTHSEYLINPDWLEATYVVKNEALDYGREIDYSTTQTDVKAISYRKFVASHPNQQDYYQPVLRALDYEPSNLEMVSSITVVEGKNDYYTFTYINRVILKNKYKLFFYPGNGATGNVSVMRLYIAWGRKFNVLLDGDTVGVKAKRHYIDDIGKAVEDKIYTLADINTTWNGKTPELLFTEAERLLIIKSLFPNQTKYSKVKFNLAMQNLLFYQTQIKLSTQTIQNFEDIFKIVEIN